MDLVLEKHIERSADVRGGKPRIIGTRITVSDVVLWHFHMGFSLDEIAIKYDLPLAAVYAAISFYFDHKEEIDTKIEAGEIFYETNKRIAPSLLREVLQTAEDE